MFLRLRGGSDHSIQTSKATPAVIAYHRLSLYSVDGVLQPGIRMSPSLSGIGPATGYILGTWLTMGAITIRPTFDKCMTVLQSTRWSD